MLRTSSLRGRPRVLLAGLTVALVCLSPDGGGTPAAHADTTDVVVVPCEFFAGGVDGDATDATTEGDVSAACGRNSAPLPAVAVLAAGVNGAETDIQCGNNLNDDVAGDDTVINDGCPQSIANLAKTIGDQDGSLSAGDFISDSLQASWGGSQISTDCHFGVANVLGSALQDYAGGMACTLDVFVFVDRREPTKIDLPAGLIALENGLEDFTCYADYNPATLGTDNDCNTAATPLNSDGVVMFHVQNDPALIPGIGSVMHSRVSQSSVEQSFSINIVGPAGNVELVLVESLIETNVTTANVTACQNETKVTEAIAPPTSTLAWAIATDQANNQLTRVPVYFTATPPEDNQMARIGLGELVEELTPNTFFSLDPTIPDVAPNAACAVICGGKETGETTIDASISLVSCEATGCSVLSARDHDSRNLTVGGVPSSNVLTAEASTIKCDGTEQSTVTAKVTDFAGNNVADGVPVNFSVVALGTANPINTETKDGTATSVITPLSNAGAGVTVIVSVGDSDLAGPIQTSVRVDCAPPLATQTPVPPTDTPTATPTDTPTATSTATPGSCVPNGQRISLIVGIARVFGVSAGDHGYRTRLDLNHDGVIDEWDVVLALSAPACHRRD